jgi:hypothetical protein
MSPAPIVVFAYRRPDHLKRVLGALAANSGVADSPLFIYCDGARNSADLPEVTAARAVARAASGFASVEIMERPTNCGLSDSILSGVTEICDRFGRAIVLEDDVLPTQFFLQYCNQALDRYANDDRIISVGCHTFTSGIELPETFLLNMPDCWGWGVWRRSWKRFNRDGAELLSQISDRGLSDGFDFGGAYPYTQMLRSQVVGGNQSWAIRWYAHAFLERKLTLYPARAVTTNIGFDGTGTHGGSRDSYCSVLTAERPIRVDTIAVAESEAGRETWGRALREMSGAARPRLLSRIRRRLVEASQPVRSYMTRARG